MTAFTEASIPSQSGKVAIVTGAGGLGYETARMLAAAGAEVILAGRNAQKGADALARLRAGAPAAKVSFEMLDLASLASIAAFAGRMRASRPSLDLLVNNAGVMAPPVRRETSDGFELQFGTNYLGHFALTGSLLPLLVAAGTARVVSLSSIAARSGRIAFDDLMAEKSYRPFPVYSQSKLATLMFALELQRRSDANGWGITSTAAHPGIATTDLVANGPGNGVIGTINAGVVRLIGQSAAAGALPTLQAATGPGVKPGGYYGPDGLLGIRGNAKLVAPPHEVEDGAASKRLWEVGERLTGVPYAAQPVSA